VIGAGADVHNAAMNRSILRILAACLVLLLGVACSSGPGARNPRDEVLYAYNGVIRWNDFDRAIGFIEPLTLAEHPIEPLDLERMKQFQVTGYDVRTVSEPTEGEYLQVVEIKIINKHTQVERIITDHQQWRWDEESARWWLVSGLPDFTAPH
jgi:hypothetical protein